MSVRVFAAGVVSLMFASVANAQIDEICRETGVVPSLDSPFAQVPYIYGRVTLNAPALNKPAKITVIFWDREQQETRWTVGSSGNYCFRRNNASGGLLVIEVNGSEAARRTLPSLGPGQLREDFEVTPPEIQRTSSPATVSAKFARPPNEKTAHLYRKVNEAEIEKRPSEALKILKDIVRTDPEDFVAWAKLGTVHFGQGELAEADVALRRSLELRVDYTPAWINAGILRHAQKRFDAAIEIFRHVLSLEPNSARAYQLLGQSSLQAQKGAQAAEALKKAIELDPVGMAECHLLLARLYRLAGANEMASREYSAFLSKVKEHPDKKQFEKFVKDNPVK